MKRVLNLDVIGICSSLVEVQQLLEQHGVSCCISLYRGHVVYLSIGGHTLCISEFLSLIKLRRSQCDVVDKRDQ
jgi:hypothetical protein